MQSHEEGTGSFEVHTHCADSCLMEPGCERMEKGIQDTCEGWLVGIWGCRGTAKFILSIHNASENGTGQSHLHPHAHAQCHSFSTGPSSPIKLPPQWVDSLHLNYSPISSLLSPGHMGHRDDLRRSCWRWLDPKKGKNTMRKLALNWRHWKEIGNFRTKDWGVVAVTKNSKYLIWEKKRVTHTTMMTSFCPLLCNSLTKSGKPL